MVATEQCTFTIKINFLTSIGSGNRTIDTSQSTSITSLNFPAKYSFSRQILMDGFVIGSVLQALDRDGTCIRLDKMAAM